MLETKLAVDVKRIGHNIPQDLHVLEPPQGQYFSLEKHIVPACAAQSGSLISRFLLNTHVQEDEAHAADLKRVKSEHASESEDDVPHRSKSSSKSSTSESADSDMITTREGQAKHLRVFWMTAFV